MNDVFGLAHKIIFKVNARRDWGWKTQRIINFSPYKITTIVKHKSFSKYYEILYLKMFHNRMNKIYYSRSEERRVGKECLE